MPFYEINVNPACSTTCPPSYNALFATGGALNLSQYYEYDDEYDAGSDAAHLHFAGGSQWDVDLSNQCANAGHSGDCQGFGVGGIKPEAKSEITSYSTQMPGTGSNLETWSVLELRHGSPSVWDTSASGQDWSTSGVIGSYQQETNGVPLNDPTSSEVQASFDNSIALYGSPAIPVIHAHDTCSTH